MAEQFTRASESGKAEDLRPPKPHDAGGVHNGHHSHQKVASSTDDSTKATGDLLTQILQQVLGSSNQS